MSLEIELGLPNGDGFRPVEIVVPARPAKVRICYRCGRVIRFASDLVSICRQRNGHGAPLYYAHEHIAGDRTGCRAGEVDRAS
jgi:hypothetical protein